MAFWTHLPQKRFGLLLLLPVTIAIAVFSHEPSRDASHTAGTFIIASPNTRSSLTDEDAQISLESFEQQNAVAVADHIACSLAPSVRIGDALGVYDKSAENSLIVESNLDVLRSRYLASLFGRYAHQEHVLYFVRQQNGPDKMWVIDSQHSLTEAMSALRSAGLVPATVRYRQDQTEILFVDFKSRSTDRVRALASALDGKAQVTEGVAALPGNEDRKRAAAIFDADIHDVEQKRKYRLSSYLWTQEWRDATSRTCSTGIPFQQ
jgi:hypothetical protein